MNSKGQMFTKTNIIILTYNKLDYTQACIDSIRAFTKRGSYQIIVVDNNSTDGTRDWLAEQSDILTIFNDENAGFPKGCNQGIELTSSGDILLLNNDVLVTENWLELLQESLHSSPDIGAVGPTHNGEVLIDFNTADDIWSFAASHNVSDPSKWEQRLKLIGFAMLIKRSVIEEVGLLDERFSPGNCEDTDYSFRIIQHGYRILYCNNVFIYHHGSVSFGEMKEEYNVLLETNRQKFFQKWGFHSYLDSTIRHDLISLIGGRDRNDSFSVLEIGAGCGATLLQLKNVYPNAKLYGTEKNPNSVAIASEIANVTLADVEQALYYPERYFDYILIGSALEEWVHPVQTLARVKDYLKDDGVLITGITNVMHYSVIRSLLGGRWKNGYSSAYRQNNPRYYTLEDFINILREADFGKIEYFPIQKEATTNVTALVNDIMSLAGVKDEDLFLASSFLFRVQKPTSGNNLEQKLTEINIGVNREENLSDIVELVNNNQADGYKIAEVIINLNVDQQELLNYLARSFYKHGLFNDIIPLLNASLEIDSGHQLTLYNYAFILHQVGADEEALAFLNMIGNKDSDSEELFAEIVEGMGRGSEV